MIEKFYELLTKVGITRGQDKVLHAVIGFGLGVVGQIIFSGSILVLLPLVLVAVGKEIKDKLDYGVFDFFDMFATLLGGFVGIVAYGLILG